jgi:hypothetical protein
VKEKRPSATRLSTKIIAGLAVFWFTRAKQTLENGQRGIVVFYANHCLQAEIVDPSAGESRGATRH